MTVAYDGMDDADRRRLHARLASMIERRFPDRVQGMAELLAHHWQSAGEREPAVAYLRMAADKAAARGVKDTAKVYRQVAEDLEAT